MQVLNPPVPILTDCVTIQKSGYFLPVMPVPDQVRDDGSGIQKRKALKLHWIPGQARNDKKSTFADLPITTQSGRRESRNVLLKKLDARLARA